MLEREIFDTTDYSKQTQAKTEMNDGKDPKMDVSNYSNVVSEDNETTNSLQVDPNNIVTETSIPESSTEQNNTTETIQATEVSAVEQPSSSNQSTPSEELKAPTQTNQFPIGSLEKSPNNEVPETSSTNTQKAVEEMVSDTTELSQLKLIQDRSENLTSIEKTVIEKRLEQLEQQNTADTRTNDTQVKASYPIPRIFSGETSNPIGLNNEDIANFISATKDPPIWRVL